MRAVMKDWLSEEEKPMTGRLRVYMNDFSNRDWVDVELRAEGLTIRGSDSLAVMPQVSNAILVGIKVR